MDKVKFNTPNGKGFVFVGNVVGLTQCNLNGANGSLIKCVLHVDSGVESFNVTDSYGSIYKQIKAGKV